MIRIPNPRPAIYWVATQLAVAAEEDLFPTFAASGRAKHRGVQLHVLNVCTKLTGQPFAGTPRSAIRFGWTGRSSARRLAQLAAKVKT